MLLRAFKTSFKPSSTLPTSPDTTKDPLNLSRNPISTPDALVATSAAIIAPSLGVMVRMPMALCGFCI